MRDKNPDTHFPIVGIGASAGGLHALECFLEALRADFDFAVVFIQHLSPSHKSLMPEILRSKWRDLEFIEIEDGLQLLPGRLYLCPPAVEVRIHEGAFHVVERSNEHIHFPIDEFLLSLAEDASERAVAVIFSGAGTDGVRGIQAVRTAGGTVFVEDPATAQFPELPRAAIETGQVDSVLPPADIAREIVKLLDSGAVTEAPDRLMTPMELEPFYLLMREKTGYSFNHYKKSVVSRRIRRRIYLHGLLSVSEYLNMVATKDGEAALLASDLMIGVTSFFRDRLAWKALRTGVIEKLAAQEDDIPLRVWTPACATGEEAYSIAMMLRHELDLAGRKREVQVFATDVNDRALEKAREGKYPVSISADVSQEFMRKFFTYSDDGRSVTVTKEMRQHVIFAKQDILTDPPFSRLDLVICRNLLIYLEPDAQEKCITLFHYALRPGGYLFLGNAESPGRKSALFKSLAHKKCRVYEKNEIEPPSRLPLTVPFAPERAAVSIRQQPPVDQLHSVIQFSQDTLLETYAPAAVTIDNNYEVLYHNGPTNRYLKQPHGASTLNLLELIPENLRNRIRGAIYKVTQEARPVSIRAGITGDEGQKRQVSISVSKMKDNFFLIVFREKGGLPCEALPESPETVCVEGPAVQQLEIELSATRHELQTNIEQLKSMNEELQSSNEEQQASNEELETSREELQSLNEELITVNTQLQSKVEEQEETNNDLNNFLSSTNVPTIFLDDRFKVKRYTPAITKLIKLIPSDVGRQIIDMSQEHLGPDLIADAQSVLENLVPVKKEIRIKSDWYIRVSLPYRTFDNRIEGVVVTYNDITEIKKAEGVLHKAYDELEVRVKERTKELKELNDTLEQHISERTAELRAANETLSASEMAALNLMEDALEARKQSEEMSEELRREVFERKRAEEEIKALLAAVHQEKTKLSTLINSISDEVWFADTQGKFTIANPSALGEFGIASGDIVEVEKLAKSLEVFRPDGSPRPVEESPPLRGLLGEVIRNQEEIIRTPATGELRYREVSTTPVRDDKGEIIGSVSIVRDISERKKAENELRKRQNLLNEMGRIAKVGGWEFDIGTLELNWTEEVYHIHEVELSYKPTVSEAINFYAPNSRPIIQQAVQRAIEFGETFDLNLEIVTAKGNHRWVHAIGKADREFKIVNGTFQDITERKRAEEEIRRLNDDLLKRNDALEFANTELESFIYSVSHDLRGPIRHMSGFSDLLTKNLEGKLDEKAKRYLVHIHTGAEKMSRLIDDLLNLSRISRQEIHRTEANISEIAASIVKELRETHPDRSVEVDIKRDLTAFVDRGLIEIALSNLLGNAWKFTARTEQAYIEFGTINQDGKPIYYVRDNGAGFDQRYAEKMFLPFHRLHSEETFEGTGIGLAIVERIIRCHRGKVWAEGFEGKGATIYFSLA